MIWSDPKIEELAKQMAFTPVAKRHEQLRAAVGLLGQIDVTEDYPWEFVLYRLTGYRPKDSADHIISGRALLADIAGLVESVSDSLNIPLADAGDDVLSLEQITQKFKVSSKTIQRWRRRGLAAMRFVYPDGVKRLGFLNGDVERFSTQFATRVEKSARFRQLSEAEKADIIRRARRLAVHCRCCLKLISRRIARHTKRSPETIRYVIRRWDAEHPDQAVFPDSPGPLTDQDKRIIVDCFDRGISVDCLAKRYCRTPSSIYRVVGQDKAQRIKNLVIRFVTNPLFDHPDADHIILTVLPEKARQQPVDPLAGLDVKEHIVLRQPNDIPAYLSDVFRQPMLPNAVIMDAFRRMNYLKAKAARLQARMDITAAHGAEIQAIESLLESAGVIRNQILQAHLRVVVHVARKHQHAQHDLFELISDGNLWMMRAVDTFDFSRGVKFSTYLTYVLMKNFARRIGDNSTRVDERLVATQNDLLDELGESQEQSIPDAVDMLLMQGRLMDALAKLPRREHDLLAAHYGLEAGQGPMSLSQIAQRMGITKARVRQLEIRALGRLRLMLEEQIDRQAAEIIGHSGSAQAGLEPDVASDSLPEHEELIGCAAATPELHDRAVEKRGG
jgi:RNA polymerase sigma factor (sigma-70 family)